MNWERHFQLGKMKLTHSKFCPYYKLFGQTILDIFISSLCIYVYSSSEWTLEIKVSLFFIFSGICWYRSRFSHFGWETYWFLDKNLKRFLRKFTVSNWYQNLDYKLIRDYIRLKINITIFLHRHINDNNKNIYKSSSHKKKL